MLFAASTNESFPSHLPTDDSDPRKVIVKKLSLLVADRDPMELDLSGDVSKLKKNVRIFANNTTHLLF